MDPALESYIRQARSNGASDVQIRSSLLAKGWPENVVNQALSASAGAPAPIQGNAVSASGIASLRPFGEMLTEAWDGYIYLLKTFWPAFAVGAVLAVGGAIAMGLGALDQNIFILGIALVIISAIVQIFLPVAMLIGLDNRERATASGLWELIETAAHRFFGFLGTYIVTGLIVIGGVFAFFIPGLVLGVQTAFATYIYLFEGRGGLKAAETSRVMVRGLGWPIFGRMVGVGLVVVVVSILIGLIGQTIAVKSFPGSMLATVYQNSDKPLQPSAEQKMPPAQQAVNGAAQALANFFIFPFPVAFMYLLYKDLRRLRGVPAVEKSSTSTKVFLGFGIAGVVLLIAIVILGFALTSALQYYLPKR